MILVTGATGYTGRFLARRLLAADRRVRFLVRPTSDATGLTGNHSEIICGDLERPEDLAPAFAGVCHIIHLAHIRHTAALARLVGAQVDRVVLVSSQRRFSRVPCPSVAEVIAGEAAARASDMPWTILRPSMIYGPGDDGNISRLARHLGRWRWVPVFGSGRQRHQPVYVEDVVDAILACLTCDDPVGRSYDLAGAAPLTYNELIDLVGSAVGVRPIKLHLPVGISLAALWGARRLGIPVPVSAAQVRRSQEDKIADIEAVRAELGVRPLAFPEGLARSYDTVDAVEENRGSR